MGLIAEALGLCCHVLGLVGWNTTLVDVYSHPLFESFDVRDKARAIVSNGTGQPSVDTQVLSRHVGTIL